MFVHTDLMINFSNWAGGYRADRAYYAVPFVGFGYMAMDFTDRAHDLGYGTNQELCLHGRFAESSSASPRAGISTSNSKVCSSARRICPPR